MPAFLLDLCHSANSAPWRVPRFFRRHACSDVLCDLVLQVQQGSLYPALHRLEQQGWIQAQWGETEGGRKAKFYSMTRAGRTQLEKELAQWDRLSTAINLVVETNEA